MMIKEDFSQEIPN